MLVLSRKLGEEIVLLDQGVEIEMKVLAIKGNRVCIGITAAESTRICRREIWDAADATKTSLDLTPGCKVDNTSAVHVPLFPHSS